ncbi:hypothetical protein [Peptoniphilus sp.]|uniref:hypothetical protein n=1 Tax=Peptoniphilus sp. TaxID=1971214 RepID=UPI0039912518
MKENINLNQFLKKLKKHKNHIERNTFKTIRGQAINGDLEGARKGLMKILDKEMINLG